MDVYIKCRIHKDLIPGRIAVECDDINDKTFAFLAPSDMVDIEKGTVKAMVYEIDHDNLKVAISFRAYNKDFELIVPRNLAINLNVKKERGRVQKFAIEVLGDEKSAKTWLKAPQKALGWEVPGKLLNTLSGVLEVEDVLGRIKHGVCL